MVHCTFFRSVFTICAVALLTVRKLWPIGATINLLAAKRSALVGTFFINFYATKLIYTTLRYNFIKYRHTTNAFLRNSQKNCNLRVDKIPGMRACHIRPVPYICYRLYTVSFGDRSTAAWFSWWLGWAVGAKLGHEARRAGATLAPSAWNKLTGCT